jgi:hypothetical protein
MMYLAVSKDVTLVAGMPPIVAVRLPDGKLGATLRSLCDLVDINRQGQIQRIHRSQSMAKALQEAVISTPGGPQQAEVLLNWAISIWAAGLHTSRLSEVKQAAAAVLQELAFAAIERAFDQPQDNPAPLQADISEARQPDVAGQISQGFSVLSASFITLATEHENLKERVTVLEGGTTHSVIGYSGQRLLQIHLFADQLRQWRGWPIAETLTALAEHFGVADVFDLPEKDWPAIRDWFTSLLEEW